MIFQIFNDFSQGKHMPNVNPLEAIGKLPRQQTNQTYDQT